MAGALARHTPTLSGDIRVRAISLDVALLPYFGEAITELTDSLDWLEVGDTVDEIVEACQTSVDTWYSDMLIGAVQMFLTATVPSGWLQLDGSTHAKVDYPELYDLLPSTITSPTNFTLPDMDEVFPMGEALGSAVGNSGGANSFTLAVANLPVHSHLYTPPVLTINAETPTTPVPTAGIGAPIQTGTTGSGTAFDNRPDYLRLFFAIYAGRD